MDEELKRLEENLRKLEDLQARLRFMMRDIARTLGVSIEHNKQDETSGGHTVDDGRLHNKSEEPGMGPVLVNYKRPAVRAGPGAGGAK